MAIIKIVKWDDHQHYRDKKSLAWVKLYRDMLTSYTWVSLDDASRVLMVALLLLAGENDNSIPADPAYIQRRAYLSKKPNLQPLVNVGFIEILEGDSRVTLEELYTNSRETLGQRREEKRIYRENIKREEKEKSARAEGVMLSDSEHATLVEKHGEEKVRLFYDRLSAHKLAKGVSYKSDYHAILKWVIASVAEDEARGRIPNRAAVEAWLKEDENA
jgi:hypothetical protein